MLSLTLAFSLAAHAKCSSGGTSVTPAPETALSANAEIVLSATGADRERFEGLRDGDLTLVSGSSRVPLRAEKLTGTFNTTQWVLSPSTPLQPGRWALQIRNEPLEAYGGGGEQPVAWMVTPEAPTAAPIWLSTPQVTGRARAEFGCGPDVQVEVDVDVAGAQWIEATVRPADGSSSGTMRLGIHDGQISIGHGMCSGPFQLERGVVYFADLVAIDAIGRKTRADDSPLRFTAP